jgi:hypothetical protein
MPIGRAARSNSMSSANRNVRTKEFRDLFEGLPDRIKNLAKAAFEMFLANPDHPALRRHELDDTKKGRHRVGTWSVSITMKYRALYAIDSKKMSGIR